jgi:hypothetical protein
MLPGRGFRFDLDVYRNETLTRLSGLLQSLRPMPKRE